MDPAAFREIVRTVTVSYPIPFIFACLIAVLLFCFVGAAVVPAPLSWVFAATGIVSFLVAVGIAIFAILRRPDLLRSERYSLASRYIDLLDDGDMDQATRDAAAKTIDGFMQEGVPKRTLPDSPRPHDVTGRH
ncbi:MAG TPA: hypothetical protein VGG99_18175 [Acetobacteraceae bacterium]|jgi:hypothetical protein